MKLDINVKSWQNRTKRKFITVHKTVHEMNRFLLRCRKTRTTNVFCSKDFLLILVIDLKLFLNRLDNLMVVGYVGRDNNELNWNRWVGSGKKRPNIIQTPLFDGFLRFSVFGRHLVRLEMNAADRAMESDTFDVWLVSNNSFCIVVPFFEINHI